MSGATPGPWVVHVEPDYSIHRNPSVFVCRNDQEWPDAQLARVNTADEFGSQEANARLIAAAPDLLEALKSLQLQAMQSTVADPANEWGQEALDLARAAIARAKGDA